MTQKQIWELFWKSRNTITEHINKIYKDWELKEDITMQKISNVGNSDIGFNKLTKYYNLQVIIAVGFKVNSTQAVSFRSWANNIIDQYISQGYALDDERLKSGQTFGGKRDYDKLINQVCAIRFDEQNIYKKIKDLFTTAIDYQKTSQEATEFFQTIQNKFHYAIVGMTSPEILVNRANSDKPALGMQSFQKKILLYLKAKSEKCIY